jgi:hypothetical protein
LLHHRIRVHEVGFGHSQFRLGNRYRLRPHVSLFGRSAKLGRARVAQRLRLGQVTLCHVAAARQVHLSFELFLRLLQLHLGDRRLSLRHLLRRAGIQEGRARAFDGSLLNQRGRLGDLEHRFRLVDARCKNLRIDTGNRLTRLNLIIEIDQYFRNSAGKLRAYIDRYDRLHRPGGLYDRGNRAAFHRCGYEGMLAATSGISIPDTDHDGADHNDTQQKASHRVICPADPIVN